jgi:TPR repeat protein
MSLCGYLPRLGLLLLVVSTLSAQSSPDVMKARVKSFRRSAEQGDAGAEMWLGASYEQGWTGRKNFKQALKWFRKAAAQGQPDAENSLGQMYQDGEGVKQNYKLAAVWYRKAAEHVPDLGGAGQGRNNLGLLYFNGWGVPQDFVQAYMWFALTPFDENFKQAQSKMTPEQILEGQRLADDWNQQHGLKRRFRLLLF